MSESEITFIPFAELDYKKRHDVFISLGDGDSWAQFSAKDSLESLTERLALAMAVPADSEPPVFVDWGGVAEHFLNEPGDRDKVRENPPLVKPSNAFIFSFTPSNKKFLLIPEMAVTANKAGFRGTIILTAKEGNRGKARVLNALAKHFPQGSVYYEDTASVLDDLAGSPNGGLVSKQWVQPDGGEHRDSTPTHADVLTLSVAAFLERICREGDSSVAGGAHTDTVFAVTVDQATAQLSATSVTDSS